MPSETDQQVAIGYARKEIGECLRRLAFIEKEASAQDQKVVDYLDQLEAFSTGAAAQNDWLSPYRDRIRFLADRAVKERAAFDALRLHASEAIRVDRPMADELRQFAAGVLSGAVQPPPLRGAPAIHPTRDRLIHALVTEIVERFGLAPTRNRETASHASACDIVARAMPRKARLPKTYSGIEAIWLRGQREERVVGDDPDIPCSQRPIELPTPPPSAD
ncbi:hypothetical protein SAMN04244567_03611 [Paracoccus pantotrophus]|nr:hypothetical protein SAMN04244567_03611 [Paracoccus pantotrophus]